MCYPLKHIKYFIMLQLSFSGLSHRQVQSAEESVSFVPFDKARRQEPPENMEKLPVIPSTIPALLPSPSSVGPLKRQSRRVRRTTPIQFSRSHYCDHWTEPCLHAYVTGKLCARTIYYTYNTFDNYCMMEYVNCREHQEMWQVVYMGQCFNVPLVEDYVHYVYHDDAFLDDYYILENKFNGRRFNTAKLRNVLDAVHTNKKTDASSIRSASAIQTRIVNK